MSRYRQRSDPAMKYAVFMLIVIMMAAALLVISFPKLWRFTV